MSFNTQSLTVLVVLMIGVLLLGIVRSLEEIYVGKQRSGWLLHISVQNLK